MIADVAARITELRGQLGLQVTTTSTTSAANGASFASSLSGAVSSGTVTGDQLVTDAKRYLGIPYVYGGTNPERGLDCSGLTQRVYADFGIKLPRTAAQQSKVGQEVPSLDQAKPGDLLFFGSPAHHVTMYIGNGKMIAAPHTGEVVKIQDVYQKPTTIRRIVQDGTQAAGTNAWMSTSSLRPATLRTGSVANSTAGSGVAPYASMFREAAAKYGISASLLAAVAKVESNYNPTAVSRVGARGLMQIMPGTAKGLGVDPLVPSQAIDGAARLLASNLRQFDGSVSLALAAYNAGAGAVRKYGGIPPYKETQAYVPKVKAAMAALEAQGF